LPKRHARMAQCGVHETYRLHGEFDFECHERFAALLGLGKRREEPIAPTVNIAADEAQIENGEKTKAVEHSTPNLPGIAALRAEVRASNERVKLCKGGASFVEMVRTRRDDGREGSRTVRVEVSNNDSNNRSRAGADAGDFDAIKRRLDEHLTDHVQRLSAERERMYARKVRALEDVFLNGDSPPERANRLDPVEWRLECERRRLKDSIEALDTHPWYARILKTVGTSESAAYFLSKPGGAGAGASARRSPADSVPRAPTTRGSIELEGSPIGRNWSSAWP